MKLSANKPTIGKTHSDWMQKDLGYVLAKIEGGGTPPKLRDEYWNGEIPWASVKDVVTHNPFGTQDHITSDGLKNSSSRLVPKGTLIVPTRMALGHAVFFNVDVAINQDLKALYPNDKTTSKYLYYWFQSKRKLIERLGSGSTVSGIQQEELKKIKFILPPLPEQERIVAVLETWDLAIEKLTQKIENKKNIKNGLMQELLTGTTRLPGFLEKWDTIALGNVSVFVNGYSFKSSKYVDKGIYKIITIANVQDGYMIIDNPKMISDIPSDINKNQVLSQGDILISMTGNVGRVCTVNQSNCLLNQRVGKIIPNGINKDMLYLILNDRRFLNTMIDRAQGGAQGNLSTEDIKQYQFDIPILQDEQVTITNIITTADKEIKTLKRSLKAIREQKRYLLSNLIRGTIRTPENLLVN